jgi:hypothetical protein
MARLEVKDWGKGYGWVIVDKDADLDDGEGGYAPMNQLLVANFRSRQHALIWLRLAEMARAMGVRLRAP